MRTFSLRFDDDHHGDPKIIEFTGEDPHEVFSLLGHEHTHRRALLFEGETLLSAITRTSEGSWQLG